MSETLKILAIGNSFSEDATALLMPIAEAGKTPLKCANLYIGGCSLERHHQNIDGNLAEYDYQVNGGAVGEKITVLDGLKSDAWDIVTVQQASHYSGIAESYEPHLSALIDYIKKNCPTAAIYMHETWAYETDSTHDAFLKYGSDQHKMFKAIDDAYFTAAAAHGLQVIPSGRMIQALRDETAEFDYPRGGQSLCRDGYHMHLLYGRYAVAALWYAKLCRGDILSNTYVPSRDGVTADAAKIELIKKYADRFAK